MTAAPPPLAGLDTAAWRLVRFCVAPDDGAARDAWADLLAVLPAPAGDEVPYPRPWRDLLPLVAWRQRHLGLDGPEAFITRLRLAAIIEEKRLTAVRDLTRSVLALPDLAAADPIVIGELALGETLYPHPATRHSTRLRLWLRPDADLARIAAALPALDLLPAPQSWRRRLLPNGLHRRHGTGFRVDLLTGNWWERTGAMAHSRLLAGGQTVDTGDGLRFCAPGLDAAWHLACRTAQRDRAAGRLLWLVDAGLLWQRRPTADRPHWLSTLAADLVASPAQEGRT